MKQEGHRISYAYFNHRLPPADFEALMDSMLPSMRQKALAYRRWEDAHAYVLGRKLLQHALMEANCNRTLADIRYNAFGRPVIDGFEDFNISHSGNVVVCAVTSQGSVGIDIEMRQPLDITDFIRLFSGVEWNRINGAASPLDIFYEYWTAKEAVLKADGRGLINDLAALDVSSFDSVWMDDQTWYLDSIPHFENYACHIASSKPHIGYTLQDMTSRIYGH
jgi:4'-phosphopantetheinyl transferase